MKFWPEAVSCYWPGPEEQFSKAIEDYFRDSILPSLYKNMNEVYDEHNV